MSVPENPTGQASVSPPPFVRSPWVSVFLIGLSVGFFFWSAQYVGKPRELPMLLGIAMTFLAVMDLLCRLKSPRLKLLRDFWGADFTRMEMQHNPPVTAELVQILWMTGSVVAMLTIGILPTVPIFIALYMFVHGRRTLIESLGAAVVVFGFVYVVFEVLLQYQLYRGAFFDPRGFAGW